MFTNEQSAIGRIVVPDKLPPGFGLFYTTLDFPGRLTDAIARQLMDVVRTRFGIEASLATCNQVHGARAESISASGKWRECDSCDALWSTQRGVALGIKVADCLPVTLIDPGSGVIANVHSGWRGAVQQVTTKSVDTLRRGSGFDPARAWAYLGPSIRACCFEVGEEVVDQFSAAYGDASRYVVRTGPKPHIDLAALTADVLRSAGFREEQIFDSGLCTRCDGSMFHSFRRERGGGGRNLAIVAQ